MLKALPPYRSPGPQSAYPVPFVVDRSGGSRLRLTNASLERLDGVTFSLLGPGTMPSVAPLGIPPGASVALPVYGEDLARATVVIVRWFRPSGDEYLWRISF